MKFLNIYRRVSPPSITQSQSSWIVLAIDLVVGPELGLLPSSLSHSYWILQAWKVRKEDSTCFSLKAPFSRVFYLWLSFQWCLGFCLIPFIWPNWARVKWHITQAKYYLLKWVSREKSPTSLEWTCLSEPWASLGRVPLERSWLGSFQCLWKLA